MTIVAACWCENGVFAFADCKRTDLLVDVELPPAQKLTQIVPWGVLATAGAGSLGDSVRSFLRSILFAFPPLREEVLTECAQAMDYMYARYVARTKYEQPLIGCFACVPPGEGPQLWVFRSERGFIPEQVPREAPYWVAASDTIRAYEVLGELWTPQVAQSRDYALDWARRTIERLSQEFDSIGFPFKAAFFTGDGKPFLANVSG